VERPATHRANSTSRRCPVDSAPAGSFAKPVIAHSSIAERFCAQPRFAGSATDEVVHWIPARVAASQPNATFSRAVSESNSSVCWKVRPRLLRAPRGGPRRPRSADSTAPCPRSVDQARTGIEHRCLSCPVRPDQAGDLARRSSE